MPKSSTPKIADLTPREARVIPLAIQWDQIKNNDDPAALKSHITAAVRPSALIWQDAPSKN